MQSHFVLLDVWREACKGVRPRPYAPIVETLLNLDLHAARSRALSLSRAARLGILQAPRPPWAFFRRASPSAGAQPAANPFTVQPFGPGLSRPLHRRCSPR